MQTEGVDARTEYAELIGAGTITFALEGTYVLSFGEAQSPRLALRERVSTQTYPIDLRLHGSCEWQYRGFRNSASINYYDGYRDLASVPQRHVSSWTTVDLEASYAFDRRLGGPLAGMTVSLGAENLFDLDPPFLNNQVGIGYDQENGDLAGRLVRVSFKKQW
jgi:iron complex outermembrane receptor protein